MAFSCTVSNDWIPIVFWHLSVSVLAWVWSDDGSLNYRKLLAYCNKRFIRIQIAETPQCTIFVKSAPSRPCLSIDLELKWVRWTENKVADTLSRFVDVDDWEISKALFDSINVQWGPFSIDRFASDKNKKMPRFNCRFSCPGAEAVDAFAQDWGMENNWLVPPPNLIPQVIRHLQNTKAIGVLVAPAWNSAKFWPFLFPLGKPASFVKDFYYVSEGAKWLISGHQPKSIFTPENFKGRFIVLKLNASM